jgi:hypothetical protein
MVPHRRGRQNNKSGKKFRRKLAVVLAAGTFPVCVAGIAAYAEIHSTEITVHSSAQNNHTPTATGRPRILPSMSRTSVPTTTVSWSSSATTAYPSVHRSKPTPSSVSPTPGVTPSPTPATSATTAPGQPGLNVQIVVFGPCIINICLPLHLTLRPVVLENGTPLTGSCEISWTIVREGSVLFQENSSSCQGDFSTGLQLGIGNYEILAEVVTSSGAQAHAVLSLYVEDAIEGSWAHSSATDVPATVALPKTASPS